MPARSVCLVTLSLSEAGPGRFGRQVSVIDIYHTTILYRRRHAPLRNRQQEEAGSGQQAARLCPCARAGGVLEAICVQWTEN